MPLRRLILCLGLCLGASLLLAQGALADAASMRAQFAELRAAAGLPAVPEAAETAQAASSLIAGAALPPQTDQTRQISFRYVRGNGRLAASLRVDPPTLALVLDPRLNALTVAGSEEDTLAVVAMRDLSVPFPAGRAVVAPARWDPGSRDPLVVVSGAGATMQPVSLADAKGRLREALGASTQISGDVQVAVLTGGRGTEIPYGQRLTVSAGGSAGVLETAPAPAEYSGALRLRGAAQRKAALIRATFRRTPPLFRNTLLPSLRGAITIYGPRPSLCGGAQVSCYYDDGSLERILSLASVATGGSREGQFVILHEFGHAVWMNGLTAADRLEWARLLRASRAYRCVPDPLHIVDGRNPCLNDDEWFADEFARWAIGDRTLTSGYETRAAVARASFVRFLSGRFAVHP